ncbi:MAG: glycoside hydrolase family 130 protein [Anaerolineae bacterium]|nr:glycoside hydrolase family 130 protein [Anaerolineae bacterium]
MQVKRTGILIKPNPRRVFFRPFNPSGEGRIMKILARIMTIPEEEVEQQLQQVLAEFAERHQKLSQFFLKRFEQVRPYLLTDQPVSEARRLLIGAYFTQEYALESAALFNPAMVWHPDQSNLPEGSRRFILSLRATGEGHISSITFRTGVIDAANNITINEPTPFVTAPELAPNPTYEKALFERKLFELGLANDFSERVMTGLGESFTLGELDTHIHFALRQSRPEGQNRVTAKGMLSLAQSNYEVVYTPEQRLSERIIFPSTPAEMNGIEDARFVQFLYDDGRMTYYATYTAYDGEVILPQLLETPDFLHFEIHTLNGPAVQNKGMALFPRKINGYYAMISRQDNENIFLMYSDHIHFWYAKEMIVRPTFPWEFVQMGNCGSPLETEAGWLVLSHGVGPMRKYSIGAFLLDLNDPTRVIGRLREPLLSPNEDEREGYVPNVVYSCGGLIHGRELIIPYAISDYASTFATVNLDDLLTELTK